MQTVGWLVLCIFPFFFGTWFFYKKRFCLGLNSIIFGEILLASILFVARFPFYRTYHSGYNQMLFTGMHEDWYALFWTFIEQYSLATRLPEALLLAGGIYLGWCFCLKQVLRRHFNAIFSYGVDKKMANVWVEYTLLLVAVFVLGRLSLFNGSWSWQHQINWENSGITNDNLLNEAILDDGQAIYRAYRIKERHDACNGLSYTPQMVQNLGMFLSGKKERNNDLAFYLRKEAKGPYIQPAPKHIFLIVSESYANWPLLPQYANFHIADGMKKIIAQSDTAYSPFFLPNGSSTVNALMGVVTNLADANLYLTTMTAQMKKPYLTAAAPQWEKLGYQTNFYYAGPATWENIGKFTKAQGFQHFYSRGDLPSNSAGSVWGVDDEYLYRYVLEHLGAQKSFTVILNVSNHSPFSLDLKSKGFPAAQVRAALPKEQRNNELLLRELGHFWYADKMLSQFITAMKAKYPDSIFVIVGDHADRYNVENVPTMYHRYAIPIIITGKGVKKDMLKGGTVGSQIDIFPTLMDLVAPHAFTYYSVGHSLLQKSEVAANYAFVLTDNYIGKTDTEKFAPHYFAPNNRHLPYREALEYASAIRAVSWWLAQHGTKLF